MKRVAAALLLLAALGIGLYGVQRSLWVDEAWVANSVLALTLSGMFHYPDWLQTTPPLFLLLVRGAVHAFGLSNFSLRLVPLALALVTLGCMLAVTRRVLSPAVAFLCCTLMAFNTVVIEYSHTLKQYSGEMAVSAIILLLAVLYLEQPSRRRLWWLIGAFVIALPLAYSAAFFLPGAAVILGIRRGGLLLAVSGVVLAILYLFFIRPNTSPLLRAFWIHYAQHPTRGLLLALLICAAALALVRTPITLVAALPCLLLAAANALSWYPSSPRTRLFVVPGFFLAASLLAEHLLGKRRIIAAAASIAAIAFLASAAWRQVSQDRNRPEEDFAGAVAFLRQNASPADMVLVHASVKEGFKLYAAMEGWSHSPPLYGDAGRPCCLRDQPAVRSVSEDLDRKGAATFRGRVWLAYSTRPSHWLYVGVDESSLWRNYFVRRRCVHGPDVRFSNLAIVAMDCTRQ